MIPTRRRWRTSAPWRSSHASANEVRALADASFLRFRPSLRQRTAPRRHRRQGAGARTHGGLPGRRLRLKPAASAGGASACTRPATASPTTSAPPATIRGDGGGERARRRVARPRLRMMRATAAAAVSARTRPAPASPMTGAPPARIPRRRRRRTSARRQSWPASAPDARGCDGRIESCEADRSFANDERPAGHDPEAMAPAHARPEACFVRPRA